jgi:hypothetical protein
MEIANKAQHSMINSEFSSWAVKTSLSVKAKKKRVLIPEKRFHGVDLT